ncbi:MAG: ribonuclease III [Acidobacteria bacterium]|nr:ribonuclease III [Acidobacteriota bacterium]
MSDAVDDRSADGRIDEIQDLIGYRFKDPCLLLQALTHRSYVNEREGAGLRNNESLEFLGDAILGFLVGARAYRLFPGSPEGELSKVKAYLVSAAHLIRHARAIRLGEFLRLGKGEEKTGGRNKRAILVDAFEAVVAAIYLDGGIDGASAFLESRLGPVLTDLESDWPNYGDFKSALQEELHNRAMPEPVYKTVDEVGPDHKKTFVVQLHIDDRVVARASGRSKKEAQQEAARLALRELRQRPEE